MRRFEAKRLDSIIEAFVEESLYCYKTYGWTPNCYVDYDRTPQEISEAVFWLYEYNSPVLERRIGILSSLEKELKEHRARKAVNEESSDFKEQRLEKYNDSNLKILQRELLEKLEELKSSEKEELILAIGGAKSTVQLETLSETIDEVLAKVALDLAKENKSDAEIRVGIFEKLEAEAFEKLAN